METVSRTREYDADPEAVRAVLEDVEGFMRGAGFDHVERDGDVVTIRNGVAIAVIQLTLELVDSPADLAYEQRAGIFDEMRTEYVVEKRPGGSALTATTEFELGGGALGGLVDGTVIRRQRAREIEAQFDYVAEQLS